MKRMKVIVVLLAIVTTAGLGLWYHNHSVASEDPDGLKSRNVDECPYPYTMTLASDKQGNYKAGLSKLTGEAGNYIAAETSNTDVPRVNLIDDHIFDAMETADPPVPHAALSSDGEFLRRIYLDLTGRPPSPQRARAFLADTNPNKRNALIEDIIYGEQWEQLVERMTLFFGDLLRNRIDRSGRGQDGSNRNAYYWYIRNLVEENRPWDRVARELITGVGDQSSMEKGYLNFLLRGREQQFYNMADQLDYLTIQTSRVFLGVTTECISCHSGRRHLEEINLWLVSKTRGDLWGMAAFFSGLAGNNFPYPRQAPTPQPSPTYLAGCNGSSPICENLATPGYDTQINNQQNGIRPPRTSPDRFIQPKYIYTGETVEPGTNYREELARLITADPQFAKSIVNYLWKEFLGVGIVDPPYAFDLARQDRKNPPPEPWTIQPSHPELLEALAQTFQDSNYNIRALIEMIVKSSTYQLSAYFNGTWEERYANYFARHIVRRLSAEQLHDSVVKTTGVLGNYKISLIPGFDPLTLNYAVQLPDPSEPTPAGQQSTQERNMVTASFNFLTVFERGNRGDTLRPDPARGSLFQAVQLMNGVVPQANGQPPDPAFNFLKPRLSASAGGTVQRLLQTSDLSNEQLADEMFLAVLSRFPTAAEKTVCVQQLSRSRDQAVEDIMWALLNKIDFVLY